MNVDTLLKCIYRINIFWSSEGSKKVINYMQLYRVSQKSAERRIVSTLQAKKDIFFTSLV